MTVCVMIRDPPYAGLAAKAAHEPIKRNFLKLIETNYKESLPPWSPPRHEGHESFLPWAAPNHEGHESFPPWAAPNHEGHESLSPFAATHH